MAAPALSRRAFLQALAAAASALGGAVLGTSRTRQAAGAAGIARAGHSPDGTPLEGIVAVDGKRYGYVGGTQQFGAAQVGGTWYHFDEVDGHMTFGRAAHDQSFYLSRASGALEDPGWLVSGAYSTDGASKRYYVHEGTHAAQAGYSTEGWPHFTTPEGNVACGRGRQANGYLYIADDEGRLLLEPGWTETDELDGGQARRYWVDPETGGCPPEGVFEADGRRRYAAAEGHVLQGKTAFGGSFLLIDGEGAMEDAEGWLTSAAYDDGQERRYYLDGSPGTDPKGAQLVGAHVGEFTVDGKSYLGRADTGYVAQGDYREGGWLYACADDGAIQAKTRAVDKGGWDFEDWAYVERMRQRAVATGSPTSHYITIDCTYPCRDVVFERIDGEWTAVAGYNAIQGHWTARGGSRTVGGITKIYYKWWRSSTGSGCCLDYIPSFPGGTVDAWNNDSQSIHAGNDEKVCGYGTAGCSSLAYAHTEWLYNNIEVETTVDVLGPTAGVEEPDNRVPSPYGHDYNLGSHPYEDS